MYLWMQDREAKKQALLELIKKDPEAVVAQKTDKRGHGFENIMISFGSVVMRSGHWMYVDENGWLVADRKLEL